MSIPTIGAASAAISEEPSALGGAGTASSGSVYFDAAQIQSKFGHAADFGITGNYSESNALNYANALSNHIDNAQVIVGTYRGNIPVTHYYNAGVRTNVTVDSVGNFISGWRLDPAQIINLLNSGNVQ